MEYFDSLIQEYYRVLINAYTAELEEAADAAIKLLITVPKAQRNDKKLVTDVVNVINEGCGADFAATVNKPVKAFMERCVRLGYNDAKKDLPVKISIGRYGAAEQSLAVKCTKEQVFWVGNQFGAETSQKFSQELGNMLKQGLTNKELATNLQKTFKDIKGKSKHYFAGLADHTALRVREFGRLEGYRRAGARGYKLVNPNDERTSDICRALIAANKI